MKIEMGKVKTGRRKHQRAKSGTDRWSLRLYIAGQTPKAVTALSNLKLICEDQLKDKYHIDVVDLLKNPRIAHDDQILAIPTLVRTWPLPEKKIIGDLSDVERVLVGLDLLERNVVMEQ